MNIEEYISSGALEAYVLGDLGEKERLEVEKHLREYPRLREELQRIEEAQERMIMAAAVQPPESLKAKVMQKITTASRGNVIPIRTEQKPVWKFAAAASILIAIAASYLAYDYRARWLATRTEYAELAARNQQLAQDFSNMNQRLDKVEGDLLVISDPEFTRILLAGTENAPQSSAYVYWNSASDAVFLKVGNLGALPQGSQYQLWGIVDGKPVDAGVFDGGTEGLIRMKSISGASAFAVTIEPSGGNAQPTLNTMQVIGEV